MGLGWWSDLWERIKSNVAGNPDVYVEDSLTGIGGPSLVVLVPTGSPGGGGGGCFVPGTLVHTPDGLIPIENIRLGDLVLGFDEEGKEPEKCFVDMTWQALRSVICHVTVEGEKISCSDNHKFFVVDRGWIMARDIKPSDKLQRISGELVGVRDVRIEQLKEPITVYNLGVYEHKNFFVTKKGILTHNQKVDKAQFDLGGI